MKKSKLGSYVLLSLSLIVLNGYGDSLSAVKNEKFVSNQGILNGRHVREDEGQLFGGVLGLIIDDEGLCTGVHIGGGRILTAYHCVARPQKPRYGIVAPSTGKIYDIGTAYTVTAPDPAGFMQVGETQQPQPDLALIKTTGKAAQVISSLPVVKLGKTLSIDEDKAYISGYGRQDFTEQAKVGELKVGKAYIDKVTEMFYILKFNTALGFSAGLPGDSGGPLLRLENGKITVYGIASILSANSAGTSGGNLYVRIDQPRVTEWLSRQ